MRGKVGKMVPRRKLRWDHPRVCGEKPMQLSSTSAPSGSPPRVRGKGSCGQLTRLLIRITPACAGKSNRNCNCTSRFEDHPRVCGEKFLNPLLYLWLLGSPPRVRGKADVRRRGAYTYRITPACAGKREKLLFFSEKNKDHPRVCGEKTKKSP